MSSVYTISHLWDVLIIFCIPFGGGIPAGVLLAKKLNFQWPMMMVLYFISDCILACCFEPIILLFIKFGKNIKALQRMTVIFKQMTQKTLEYYGNSNGVMALIMIAFGVDPMTGRAVAVATGHGFISGWMIAIAGDMLYFSLLMVSTLWLNDIIGDGNITMLIILGLMIALPYFIRRFREKILSK